MMPSPPDSKGVTSLPMESKKSAKLGTVSGVYIPVYLNILSILMFLRFGLIIGQVGFIGILGKPLSCSISCLFANYHRSPHNGILC